jgi:hypothetical protein
MTHLKGESDAETGCENKKRPFTRSQRPKQNKKEEENGKRKEQRQGLCGPVFHFLVKRKGAHEKKSSRVLDFGNG